MIRRPAFVASTVAVTVALLLFAAGAQAATGPQWYVVSMSNTTAALGSQAEFIVEVLNRGEVPIPSTAEGNDENCVAGAPPPADPGKCIRVTATFPAGLTPAPPQPYTSSAAATGVECGVAGQTATCGFPSFAASVQPRESTEGDRFTVAFRAKVSSGASGLLTPSFRVEGGEAPTRETVDPVHITATPPDFGIEAFDAHVAADASGTPLATAGAHPYAQTTAIDFNTLSRPQPIIGPYNPVEPARDVLVELPPGFVGDPTTAAHCTFQELVTSKDFNVEPLCPSASQVGLVMLKVPQGLTAQSGPARVRPPLPLYNMVSPPGVAARFAFNSNGVVVVLDAELTANDDGEYVVSVGSRQVTEALATSGVEVEFWGVPADPAHDFDRSCPSRKYPRWLNGFSAPADCPEAYTRPEEQAFLRMPTSCIATGAGMPWRLQTDSWFHPGGQDPVGRPVSSDLNWKTSTIESHAAPSAPHLPSEWGPPVAVEGCENVPFEPVFSAKPTTDAADRPSGLEVEISMPQHGLNDPEAIGESDLRDAVVKLPEGMVVNPSAAGGLGACSAAQIGLTSAPGAAPILFSGAPQGCPDNSKIGIVEIETPLLNNPLKGAVYLAAQGDNPFKSLLALYLVVEDAQSGIVLKLPGRIDTGPKGELETIFEQNPQTPFTHLHVSLFGGPRAALRTPPSCGTHTTQAKLTPWSRPEEPVTESSSFQITEGCSGDFDPKLSAGTENPLAGTYSPFSLRLTREDGTQELAGLRLSVPEGLLANLKGIPYCSDATLAAISGELGTGQGELDSPSCPAASAVGTVTVGAGAGSNPFYTSNGRAYWAGPYKGAPVSLAVVVPAVAGPFDLGSVVVRNGFEVDPESAQITAVADPFPTILHGIPLDLRDVRVQLDRPSFTLNPTSCEPMEFTSLITSSQGATASPTERFQVAGCGDLAFKPKLVLRLKGKTNRGGHPALRATLTMPEGGANIAKAQVTLPKTQLLENSHIRTICTRVQYAADQCPNGSIYGYARAYSPILDYYLSGPVYLRSSDHKLPDLVAALDGQIEIDVVGRIDAVKGRLRSTFESVPDAPVSKFVLSMQGGRKGLLTNERELCGAKPRATALFDGHNGKIRDSRPLVKVDCGKKRKRAAKRKSVR